MCVIDNGKNVIVNTNDCPFQLGHESASRIKENYKEIDFLLAGYSSATAYPQCFELSESVLEDAKKTIKEKFLRQTESYVNLFKPKYFMPFAGRYVLSGKNHFLNEKRSIPELEEAYDYFEKSKNIEHDKSKCILLNQKSNFDLSNNTQSENYTHIIKSQKLDYIEKHLSKQKYDYEQNEFPSIDDLLELLEKSFSRFDSKCKELGFSSDTTILISLPGENILKIPCNGESFELIPRETLKDISKYVYISLDSRLLKLLLSGPKYAHWNNAEIGSHLKFKRNPNVYERALFYCLNYLHA
jgi:UDP-MurNAc hydroxylase